MSNMGPFLFFSLLLFSELFSIGGRVPTIISIEADESYFALFSMREQRKSYHDDINHPKRPAAVLYFDSNDQLRKASDYFPLQVGNIWEYDSDNSSDYRIEIVGDTVIADTQRVYRALTRFFNNPGYEYEYSFYEYNKDSTVIYRSHQFPQEPYTGLPIIDTRGGIGAVWRYVFDYVAAFAITDTGSASYFDRVRRWAQVQSGVFVDEDSVRFDYLWYWRVVEGIGLVRETNDTLVYAKVNDVEYGTPLIVSARSFNHPIPKDPTLRVHPNPVHQQTTIDVELASPEPVEIKVMNVLGQTVRLLFMGNWPMGRQQFVWDGRDDRGRKMSTGIYFVVLQSQSRTSTINRIIFLQ